VHERGAPVKVARSLSFYFENLTGTLPRSPKGAAARGRSPCRRGRQIAGPRDSFPRGSRSSGRSAARLAVWGPLYPWFPPTRRVDVRVRGKTEMKGCAASTERDATDLGCVKTCAREEDAELSSLLSTPDSGRQCCCFFKLTKSRRNFYPQIRFRSFHTAKTHSRHFRSSFDHLVGERQE
jgi:hypothetical protein